MHLPRVTSENSVPLQPAVHARPISGRLLPWLVLAASLAVTSLLWKNALEQTTEKLQEDFDFRAREIISKIEQRMLAYEYVLRGVQGLFAASRSVGRDEFRSYVDTLHLEENYPGIQGVGYSLIVKPDELERHTAAVRRETSRKGMPEYTIHPEGKRDYYTSIVYLEPFSGRNLRAFGYDMYSEPVRHAAMEQACDTGKASISGKVRLVQETEKDVQSGFLMYLPVYRNGIMPSSIATRRASIAGWVYAPFRINDLMHGIEGERSSELDMDIYDGTATSDDALMYDTDDSHNEHGKARFSVIHHIDVPGHQWTLRIYSNPAFGEREDTHKPRIIGLGGTITSLLVAMLAWSLVRGRERAIQAAREMNHELIRSEQALHDSEEKLRAILNSSEAGIAWADEKGVIEYANPKFVSMFGYTLDDTPTVEQWYLHAYPDRVYREKTINEWNSKVAHSLPNRSALEHMEVSVTCKDGSVRQVLLMGSWAGNMLVATFSDITELKLAEEAIKHMAHHDALTGLPNRIMLSDRIEQSLAAARRNRNRLALLLIDLDKFKQVNDTYGHTVGDLVLKHAARRIQDSVRESDTVSRLGGDEFVVLLPVIDTAQDALSVAGKILQAMERPFELAELVLHISASLGVSLYPDHGDEEIRLTTCADIAMYEAKKAGRDNVQLYRPDMPQDGT